MNQKNTNQATKVLNPFLGFGWYTGIRTEKNTSQSERTFNKLHSIECSQL